MRVQIDNVTKRYGGKDEPALHGISLAAEESEFLVLLGPSGSGKTTLLRAIAGLESIDAGRIVFDGEDVSQVEPARRNVAMVFQDYALYPHMSVRKNISYNMRIRKLPAAEVDRRVRETSAMLGIEHLLDRKPAELSGGERQRVAVARAITRDSSLLLMDEPLSNLDAQIREHVRVELREVQRRLGVTTVYVTHDQVEAMVMADRIAVMADGQLQQLGEPDEIYDRPRTLFCARFIGSPKINELRGRIRSLGGHRLEFLPLGDGDLRIGLEARGEAAVGEPWTDCTLAFRAEDSELRLDGEIPGSVTLVENRGVEKYVVANLPDHLRPAQASAELRLRLLGQRADVGGRVHFAPTRVHVFGVDGERLLGGVCTGVSNGDVQQVARGA